jgi:hypothetical protein
MRELKPRTKQWLLLRRVRRIATTFLVITVSLWMADRWRGWGVFKRLDREMAGEDELLVRARELGPEDSTADPLKGSSTNRPAPASAPR